MEDIEGQEKPVRKPRFTKRGLAISGIVVLVLIVAGIGVYFFNPSLHALTGPPTTPSVVVTPNASNPQWYNAGQSVTFTGGEVGGYTIPFRTYCWSSNTSCTPLSGPVSGGTQLTTTITAPNSPIAGGPTGDQLTLVGGQPLIGLGQAYVCSAWNLSKYIPQTGQGSFSNKVNGGISISNTQADGASQSIFNTFQTNLSPKITAITNKAMSGGYTSSTQATNDLVSAIGSAGLQTTFLGASTNITQLIDNNYYTDVKNQDWKAFGLTPPIWTAVLNGSVSSPIYSHNATITLSGITTGASVSLSGSYTFGNSSQEAATVDGSGSCTRSTSNPYTVINGKLTVNATGALIGHISASMTLPIRGKNVLISATGNSSGMFAGTITVPLSGTGK